MKKLTVFGCIALLASCATARPPQKNGPGAPVVFTLDAGTLANNKNRIKAADAAVMPAYRKLLKDANEALKFGPVSVMEKKNMPPSGDKHDYMSLAPYHWPDPTRPDGLPYIRKDGETNPEVKEYKDKEYLPKLCGEVHELALAWYFSEDKVYAEHAAKLLRVWFLDTATRMNPNLNYGQAIKGHNTGRGAGMIDVRHFIKLVDAIGLFNNSSYWTKADQAGMQQWFADFLNWMQTSKIGKDEMDADNNHGAWYEALRLSLALFTNNMELAKKSVATAQTRLDSQMDENGFFPKELARTTSLHYSTFVLEAFFNIASMSGKTGVDFWKYTSPGDKSLQKGFNAIYPYWTQRKPWAGEQIKDFKFEEAWPLLLQAAGGLPCKNCRDEVKQLVGDKFDRLPANLLY